MNQTQLPVPTSRSSKSKSSRNFHPVLAAIAFLTGATYASAQIIPGASDQLNNSQQRRTLEDAARTANSTNSAPELYSGESDDVGPQSVLAIKDHHWIWEASADSQYYFSDNALLDSNARVASGILVSTVQASLAYAPIKLGGGTLVARAGLRYQWYNFLEYESHDPDLNSYDFDGQTAFIEGRWFYGNWILGAGFDATRLVTASAFHQFYTEYVPRYEASRIFKIDKTQTVTLNYQGFYHQSYAPAFPALDPALSAGVFNRLDQYLQATYIWQPGEHAVLQPYYSLRYTHYTSTISRDDDLQSVGLAVYWIVNEHLTARGFASYDQRYSSVAGGAYHQISGGFGANLAFRF